MKCDYLQITVSNHKDIFDENSNLRKIYIETVVDGEIFYNTRLLEKELEDEGGLILEIAIEIVMDGLRQYLKNEYHNNKRAGLKLVQGEEDNGQGT